MQRREFITLLGGATAASSLAWPLAAGAQPAGDVARVGVLGTPVDSPAASVAYPHFLGELRKLGFTNGQNVVVEFRRIDEGVAKAFASANELAAARTNVLFAFGPELALQAAAASGRRCRSSSSPPTTIRSRAAM
jgi:putative ABC transport system substrate-binding protein